MGGGGGGGGGGLHMPSALYASVYYPMKVSTPQPNILYETLVSVMSVVSTDRVDLLAPVQLPLVLFFMDSWRVYCNNEVSRTQLSPDLNC